MSLIDGEVSSIETASLEPLIPRGRVQARAKFFFQGGRKFFVKGVTYGPFKPFEPNVHLHSPEITRHDLQLIAELGANVVRLYHVPPRWFLDLCHEYKLQALITIPWEQHVSFLDTRSSRLAIQSRIREGVRANVGHPAVFGYMVGNEIPSNTIRWYGLPRVKWFIETLLEIAKETDPKALVTYANYPSTEYLIPNNCDFFCYNVYLEKQESFQKYLSRLHNIAEEKPLLLGEFGMDSRRNGEEKQADVINWHIRTVGQMGLAGTIVFAWTDDWFTGNFQITDWEFGLVTADRKPKAAYYTVQDCFVKGSDGKSGQRAPLAHYPKVSVVVCSYNGGRTLQACLQSLRELDYPNYEVILVDDGSTDNTRQIVKDFPEIIDIVQPNMGLSYARNTGYKASTGDVVAYTDSDCMVDRDWVYYLIASLQSGDFAGVGGPNISPPAEDWIQACVGAAPGSPSHVLLTDTIAEHIPGCNMAFHRWALDLVGGWDVEYRKAGDDVDFCWRLQQAGHLIGFSPSAIVWHHRRFTVKAFFKQQMGYGEAESLLRFKHLIFFSPTGGAKWKGSVYGLPRYEKFMQSPIIYHGVFGLGLFQSIYPAQDSAWAGLISSLEWFGLTCALAFLCLAFPGLKIIPIVMLGAMFLVAFSYMHGARLEPKHDLLASRALVFFLAFTQPILRGYARYFTWVSLKRTPNPIIIKHQVAVKRPKFERDNILSYWSEDGVERDRILHEVVAILESENWSYSLDTGWTDWDIQIYGNIYWNLKLRSMTENHGGNKRLNRIQLVPRFTTLTSLLLIFMLSLFLILRIKFGFDTLLLIEGVIFVGIILSIQGLRLRNRVGEICELAAGKCGFVRVEKTNAD
ncbi:MAG: glycosyltransferase [Verrucomicrobiota bacterium]|nr:glycosyltransferase [Verrucomicrobiota bacterium]